MIFRLTDGDIGAIEFESTEEEFKSKLNDTFLAYTSKHGERSVTLHIWHEFYGWCHLSSDSGTYWLISNPLGLNAERMLEAVQYTLAKGDMWASLANGESDIWNSLIQKDKDQITNDNRRSIKLVVNKDESKKWSNTNDTL